MAGHSQPRVSPMYWDLLNQNWESEPGCWLFMTHESVLSSVHCFVHLTPPLSHQLTGQWSGSLLSTKYSKGFNAINVINAIFFFLRKMKGSGISYYGQNVKICPIYFKAQNCDFTVRTEISTCLLNFYHTCGWWPEKVRLVWYDHLTGGS